MPVSAGGGTPFLDVTVAAGVAAPHHARYLVTGQAWGDYDGDGYPDLYVTDSAGPNTLFHNNGDGTFSVSPHSAAMALPGVESGGAVFADYNNDGWADLYVLNRGANVLYRNDGGQGFTDVTAAAGVGEMGQGESATWGDFDKDGWPDLYVVNWYDHEDEDSPFAHDSFYRNNGDGTFTDITSFLDQTRISGPGYAATFVDYDNDADQDLYVVIDKNWGNLLFRNDGPGCGGWCFTDVSAATGADRPVWGMGISTGDYDLDGDLDFYFSSIGEQVLLQNQTAQGNPVFVEVSQPAGVGPNAIGWGSVFFDYNRDGWLDLYLSAALTSNFLFRNRADGTFEAIQAGSGADHPGFSIGVAKADYDRDGRQDLVVGNYDLGYSLYHNELDNGNHWLSLRLEGRGRVTRDALGTRVVLLLSDGRVFTEEVTSDSSLGAGNDLALFFGFGSATPQTITISWPDGFTEHLTSVPVDTEWHHVYPLMFADGFESGDTTAWSGVDGG
ncbi:MAG: CRTAC1 family protein [Acidobacteria bacterium]|nr:CRTAC1 family protein [Acidobacteriota bacterium]